MYYIEDDKPGWQMQEDHKLGLAAPVPAHPVPGQLPHPQLRLSPGGEGRVVLTEKGCVQIHLVHHQRLVGRVQGLRAGEETVTLEPEAGKV